MHVEQLYTNCLSEAAYFICDEKDAAVIDPLRDVDVYLKKAVEKGVTIKYIFETHFHADFVSGHLELAQKTGATIVYGPSAETGFKTHVAKDNEIFQIGNLKMQVLHTPGHTLESSCFLLHDESGNPYCLFTGDTLFVGDVGRPDLFSGNKTKEDLAAMLYDSLNQKVKPLADNIIVFPAHGPGSACGKKLGSQTTSTIGEQKQSNYALQEMTKEEFVSVVTEGLTSPPAYFPINATINKQGYNSLDDVLIQGNKGLTITDFKDAVVNGALILDTRKAIEFTEGFVPGSISIGLEGRFAEWAGSILPYDKTFVLVTEDGKEEETIVRLARVGIDNIAGYLAGGYDEWVHSGEKIDMIIDIEPDELAMDIPHEKRLQVIDVRKPAEFEAGHIRGAVNVPLDTLTDVVNMANVDDNNNLYIHCAGGYRSVIAASLMKRQGYHNLRNVLGGFSKMKEVSEMPIVYPERV